MNFSNINDNELNVRRTKYAPAQPAISKSVIPVLDNTEICVESVSVAEETFSNGKRQVTFVVPDTEANNLLRSEVERVGAREFDENAGLFGIVYSLIHRVKARGEEDRRPYLGNIIMIAIFAVVLCLVAVSYSEYNATYSRIKKMEAQIEDYKTEQKQLAMAIEERDDFGGEMENYVINVLGMVKEESLTKNYYAIEAVDLVTVRDGSDIDRSTGGVLLSGFKSILSRLFLDIEA